MDTESLARYVELEQRKRDLKNDLKDVNSEIEALEEKLLPQFEAAGVQNMRINGMTVYIHRQLWAGAPEGNREAVIGALRASGLEDYVVENFNTQSLSAWVREQVAMSDDDELEDVYDALPESFRGNVNISERFELRSRRS